MEQDTFDLQVLGLALRQPGAIAVFACNLDPIDVGFVHGYAGIHQVYKAMVDYWDKTGQDIIEPISFKSWLESDADILAGMGGADGISRFIDSLMTIELSSVDATVELVKFRANKRRKLDNTQELIKILSNNHQSPGDKERITLLTEQINGLQYDLKMNPLSLATKPGDIIARIDDLWNIPPFITTQFLNLNKALGYNEQAGLFRGAVHAVIALSGQGKSTFVKCVCNHVLDQGMRVLYINFEEAQDHWERILMTQIIEKNVYANAFTASTADKNRWSEVFAERLETWGDRLIVRHDMDSLFFEDLEMWFKDIMISTNFRPDMVVIDTIQSMFTKGGGRARWGEFELMMVRLEKLAKDMDAAFLLTSQQNNNSLREGREVLDQSDVGGSVTIAQKSSVVMIISRPKTEKGDEYVDESLMEVQIPKNRITGTAFSSRPPMIRYIDEIKSYIPYDPNLEDPRYSTEYIDETVFEGGTY